MEHECDKLCNCKKCIEARDGEVCAICECIIGKDGYCCCDEEDETEKDCS